MRCPSTTYDSIAPRRRPIGLIFVSRWNCIPVKSSAAVRDSGRSKSPSRSAFEGKEQPKRRGKRRYERHERITHRRIETGGQSRLRIREGQQGRHGLFDLSPFLRSLITIVV